MDLAIKGKWQLKGSKCYIQSGIYFFVMPILIWVIVPTIKWIPHWFLKKTLLTIRTNGKLQMKSLRGTNSRLLSA